VNYLDSLDPKYRLILCDIWGVVHDGVHLYTGAADRLWQWKDEGRCVGLITNAPRTADAVEQQLARIGLPDDAYDFVATSGEAGIEALNALGQPVGFVGTPADREILESRGVQIAQNQNFVELACTGLTKARPNPKDYLPDLEHWVERDVHMHCLNPDRVPEACAGAIADIYQSLGGRVTWYGKPHKSIYLHALQRAGNPPAGEVLAIGDGLQTDMLGAARMGFAAVFVSGGIHAGESFPDDFATQYGLGSWAPLAAVVGLS
jgi:HAD superfamily hydrolase (TIGR01459 family)